MCFAVAFVLPLVPLSQDHVTSQYPYDYNVVPKTWSRAKNGSVEQKSGQVNGLFQPGRARLGTATVVIIN